MHHACGLGDDHEGRFFQTPQLVWGPCPCYRKNSSFYYIDAHAQGKSETAPLPKRWALARGTHPVRHMLSIRTASILFYLCSISPTIMRL